MSAYRALGYVLESARALPLVRAERAEGAEGLEVDAPRVLLEQGAPRAEEDREERAAGACVHAVQEATTGLTLRALRVGSALVVRYGAWWLRAEPPRAGDDARSLRVRWCHDARGLEQGASPGPDDDARGAALASLLERVLLPLALLLRDEGSAAVLLHGNAVRSDGRAVVLVGASGAGKSTASAALVERGARLLADDRVPCFVASQRVGAGPTTVRLHAHSLALAGGVPAGASALGYEPDGKVALRFDDARVACDEAPLGALVLLERDEAARAPVCERSLGAAAVSAVLLRQHFALSAPPPALRAAQFRALLALTRAWAPRALRFRYAPSDDPATQRAQLDALWSAVRGSS